MARSSAQPDTVSDQHRGTSGGPATLSPAYASAMIMPIPVICACHPQRPEPRRGLGRQQTRAVDRQPETPHRRAGKPPAPVTKPADTADRTDHVTISYIAIKKRPQTGAQWEGTTWVLQPACRPLALALRAGLLSSMDGAAARS